jgi:hypothetical protein
MRLAALKRQLRDLVGEMEALAGRIETISEELDRVKVPLPFRYCPPECGISVGELRLSTRPTEAVRPSQYWGIVARQIEDMIHEAEDRDHWIRQISRQEPFWHSDEAKLAERLTNSEWVRAAIGPVPELIFPEQFRFASEQERGDEEQSLEDFFNHVYPEAC